MLSILPSTKGAAMESRQLAHPILMGPRSQVLSALFLWYKSRPSHQLMGWRRLSIHITREAQRSCVGYAGVDYARNTGEKPKSLWQSPKLWSLRASSAENLEVEESRDSSKDFKCTFLTFLHSRWSLIYHLYEHKSNPKHETISSFWTGRLKRIFLANVNI